ATADWESLCGPDIRGPNTSICRIISLEAFRRGHTSCHPHDMKLLVTIAVYISRRRGGDAVATLQTYAPVAAQTWSAFLPNPPNPPAVSNTSGGSFTATLPGGSRLVWRR